MGSFKWKVIEVTPCGVGREYDLCVIGEVELENVSNSSGVW